MTGKLRDSGCLDLVISLISPGEENEDSTLVTLVTQDIEKAIKLEEKEQKVQQRELLKQKNIASKLEKKRSKDMRSRKSSAQGTTPVTPVQQIPPEIAYTAPIQQPRTDIVDKAVARTAADNLQKEGDKLRPHACLAIATFVDHEELQKTIVERHVLEALVDLVKENSDEMSLVAAQALLHMLGSDGVAEYIVDKGPSLTEQIIDIALKEDTKVPVSAARILEKLAEHGCTREIMAKSGVPKTLFDLLKAGDKNFIKASRLNALCEFADYDDLRPALLEIQLVPFLVKKAGRKNKHKRKACLTALITLAGYDKMHAEILNAESTLVSLCAHKELRSRIIQMDFLKILVHRLGKKKDFDDAQDSLNALIQYGEWKDEPE
ncbi:ARM repeat-containing protein [Athelia psychrophila]|uniref:ARM repeat-containing protein n=1 Tax=Athelia psychrophila TaxID=1759441 RepID=A0A166F7J1_9AGAM|nr:ARM repeat-containing protein [Fibularhizoctonia sp. CBS 109695]